MDQETKKKTTIQESSLATPMLKIDSSNRKRKRMNEIFENHQNDKKNKANERNQIPLVGIPNTIKERTLIIIKPDGVRRALIGEILSRFEKKGFQLVGIKLMKPSLLLAKEHYKHQSKFLHFENFVKFFSNGPNLCMVWQGYNVIKLSRQLIGHVDPTVDSSKVHPIVGTIRGDFSSHIGRMVIHGSDSILEAQREIQLWFKEEDILDWQSPLSSDVFTGYETRKFL
jgi:nucleoside-diphosphate kinase